MRNEHGKSFLLGVLIVLLVCVSTSHCENVKLVQIVPDSATCSSHFAGEVTCREIPMNKTPVDLCRDAIHSFKVSLTDADQLDVNKFCSAPETVKYSRYNKWIKEVK